MENGDLAVIFNRRHYLAIAGRTCVHFDVLCVLDLRGQRLGIVQYD